MDRALIGIYEALVSVTAWPTAFFLRNHVHFRGTVLQRLGLKIPVVEPGAQAVWFHASSVGEVKAVAGLIKSMKNQWPGTMICMSCMTATGRDVAARQEGVDMVMALPFDTPFAMKRHMLRLMPKALLIAETEIWPCMILEARRLGIPAIIVNARMSKRAFTNYMRVPGLFRPVLSGVKVLAIAHQDAERFRDLGARDVHVLGNLKLDAVALADRAKASALRAELGIGRRPVFIAGSVREGEEAIVMDAAIRIAEHIPELYTIVAPRHPDRVGPVLETARGLDISLGLRSRGETGRHGLVLDTMGELFTFYGASDAAFVGGSLVDLGGQNILEPVAWGVPTLHGPSMDNFTWALEAVQGHTIVVKDSRDLARAVIDILRDPDARRSRGEAARKALAKAAGVTHRYLEAIGPYMFTP